MSNWNDGYCAEIDYTFGYYHELSPALLSTVLLNKGIVGNSVRAPRYLEPGCGQGVSLAVHAAACEGEFWGVDFLPRHAAYARALVEASGSNARIFDQSFAEFAARDDLPEFDVITLQGVWSWIAPEHRATVIDLVRRRLAVGGTLYVSYNAMPGCAPLIPVRDLMVLHARLGGAAGRSMPARVTEALRFTRSVIDVDANYFFANPIVAAGFKYLETKDVHYLAHEYFNEHWQPMGFAEMTSLLAEAKVDFVGSARLAEHIDALHVDPKGLAVLEQIGHPVLRESVRDLMTNNRFRADVFVRGGLELTELQRLTGWLAARLVLATPPDQVPMTLKTVAGELQFDETIYRPLLDALADDNHAAKALASLRTWPALEGKPVEGLIQALLVLINEGHVYPAQSDAAVETARARCQALNHALLADACFRDRIDHLASPVTGAGHRLRWAERLFLLAHIEGVPPERWAQFAYAAAKVSGTRLSTAGEGAMTAEEELANMDRQAVVFAERRMPILQTLGIA